MDLSIVIVNYNVKEFLQNLLDSIVKASKNLKTEVIVIDNASDDGSVDLLKEKFPWVVLIESDKNLGFSRANNIGLKRASGKFLLLLNPDTIVQENTFETMLAFFFENLHVGLAGCKILNPDGTLQLACRRSFPGPWVSFGKVTGLSTLFPKSRLFARYNLTYLDENQTYEVDAIMGSFMMLRREVYEKIGGLDEQFFMYGEDLDWCYRVQLAGYKVFYVHTTQIIHYKGESTKRSNLNETKIFYEAMHLFVRKHLSSSFIVEAILRVGIFVREMIATIAKNKLIVISIILDSILFNISIIFAEKIYTHISQWRGFPAFSLGAVFTIPVLIQIVSSSFIGSYKKATISVMKNSLALIVGFLVITSLTFFFKDYAFSRGTALLTYFIAFFLLSIWRIIAKLKYKIGFFSGRIGHGRAVIIGTEGASIDIAEKLKSSVGGVSKIIGLIGLTRREIGKKMHDFEIIGCVDNLSHVIRDRHITEVIFPPENISYQQMMMIVAACQKENVEFQLAANNLEFVVGKSNVKIFNDLPVIELNYNISLTENKIIKRVFDLVLSVCIFVFCFPVLFMSGRFGKNKGTFAQMILKSRKVFLGKISFVGPEAPNETEGIFLGKQGITGLWFTDMEDERMREKIDLFYAKNQNIWFDLMILGKTLNKLLMERK